ncbi:hypothetical protein A3B57_01325 [Microgenomates group bacterium RIFCSPLOWO2_01_FULL_47_10]|nr:MAG: hypothetical protein A3B57_01325 [Microgenomates group bacterium RIFCSPLOWO2_01_FULL_47_10]
MKTIPQKITARLANLHRRFHRLNDLLFGVATYNLSPKPFALPPREMIINVTYWCNSRCVMCNIWQIKPKSELSYEDWEWIMQDKIFRNIRALTISGGEPTMNKDLVRLAELYIHSMPKLKKLGMITNGFTPEFIIKKIEAIAKLCRKHDIHFSVSVSVDGVGKMHETIRRIPDGFNKTMKTVQLVSELKQKYDISLGVGSLLLRQNLGEYEKTKKWFEERNIPINFQIVGFHETFVNNLETKKDLDFVTKQKDALAQVLQKLAKPTSLFDFRSYYWRDLYDMYVHKKPRTTPCPFQYDQFVMDSFGDVYYCLSERKIGNVRNRQNSVSQIYYDPKNLAFRKGMTKSSCLKCNSGCNADYAIARDMKKYLWFRITKKLWPARSN